MSLKCLLNFGFFGKCMLVLCQRFMKFQSKICVNKHLTVIYKTFKKQFIMQLAINQKIWEFPKIRLGFQNQKKAIEGNTGASRFKKTALGHDQKPKIHNSAILWKQSEILLKPIRRTYPKLRKAKKNHQATKLTETKTFKIYHENQAKSQFS